MKILQFNSGRSTEAMSMACNYTRMQNIDILIISEPNVKEVSKPGWMTDVRRDAAIRVINPQLAISGLKQDNAGFVSVKINGVWYHSCYISPNCTVQEFENYLGALQGSVSDPGRRSVIAGDFNAKSTTWGGKITDNRGDILMDWIAGNRLVTQNQGSEPTFRRNTSSSIIDLTITSENIAGRIIKWKVLQEESLSDHMYIYYELTLEDKPQMHTALAKPLGWKIGCLETFVENFKIGIASAKKNSSGPLTARDIVDECTKACNMSFSTKKASTKRKPAYWWNDEVASLRKTCSTYKRMAVRNNKNSGLSLDEKQFHHENYKKRRKLLKNAIAKAKQYSWKRLCEEIDEDIWGLGYKIVMKKTKMYPTVKLDDCAQLQIAKELFPSGARQTAREMLPEDISCPPFQLEELELAISQIKNKRAAGPDLIPPEIVKAAATAELNEMLQVYNRLLIQGIFPSEWKKAKLILIQKPNSSKFRPICLLDVFGKLFERLIANRLYDEVKNKLSDRQYGFRKGRSTTDAMAEVIKIVDSITTKAPNNRELCIMATIDIRNAFNSAPWNGILSQMNNMGVSYYLRRIIANYLAQRSVLVGSGLDIQMECGVPQGSILGPILWNILYDQVLRVQVPTGTIILGFADDTAVVTKARTQAELVSNINWTLLELSRAISSIGLTIAAEKTEAVILYGGRKLKKANIQVQNVCIETRPYLKYLGVLFDYNLQMKQQVIECAKKAERTVQALSKIMGNLGGPKSSNRRTLASVTHSTMLYAVPVWSRALQWKKYNNLLARVQRRIALRVCCGFRTVSTEVALVLAGIIPIQLQIKKRCSAYWRSKGINSEVNEDSLTEWQKEWQSQTNKGAWTKVLIPDIIQWVKRKHGEVDFYLSQLLSGHGWFNAYRKRFHLHEFDLCNKCHVVEDAGHVFFQCEKWRSLIQPVNERVGTSLTPHNCVNFMMESVDNWQMVATMARIIIQERMKET